ncbi:MAG: hypothetical protein IJ079_06980 [Lachnospiraceae bacterium]|nr:hypothetical protein [Lachnospiraceae bacterium]
MENHKSKLYNFIIIMVFLTFIGFFGIAYIIVPDREYSELENRYLTTFPELSWERLMSGEFMSDFDSYTADQIYGKDLFVKGNVVYNRMLGIKEINGVLIGRDGYLIQDYQAPGSVLNQNLQSIQNFAEAHPEADMTLLLAPNVNEIYPEKLPTFAQTYPQSEVIARAEETLDAANLKVVDVTDILTDQKSRDMYYKTDHHWTTLGAFMAYKELCDASGRPSRHLDDYEMITLDTPFYGSLYSKAPVTESEGDEITFYRNPLGQYKVTYVNEGIVTDSMYDSQYLDRKDKYAVFFGGNYALITIENLVFDGLLATAEEESGTDSGEVLILKDSYANALIPFLADDYAKLHVIDLRYYHDDLGAYMEENHIRQVILIHNVDFLSTDNSFVWLE